MTNLIVEKRSVVYRKALLLVVVFVFLFYPATLIAAGSSDIEAERGEFELASSRDDLLLFFDESDLIVSATMHPQSLKKAPAIATVFTEKDIHNMGARDMIDVLRRVPGFTTTTSRYGLETMEVRGITSGFSERVKLLIDGHSVNSNAQAGSAWSFDNLSLDNVKRIEVIRGPGSALYGSNAFLGVVSVVTKDGKDIDGVVLSVGGGSFDTEKYNLLAGKRFGDLDIALMLDYMTTDGDELFIGSDFFGMSGNTLDFGDKFDGQLKLAYKDLALNVKYIDRKDGPYIGISSALNDETRVDVERFFADLKYKRVLLDGDLPVTARAYLDRRNWRADWEIFSEGTLFPAVSTTGIPSVKEKTVGLEVQADYSIKKDNLLTVGALVENRKQYDVEVTANFELSGSLGDASCLTLPPSPFPLMDVTGVCNWNKNVDRDIWALYVQDVWDINDDLSLTAGLRHDDYSDFGSSTNPRLAMVWGFKKDWDLKLMYATAFRAPAFSELYIKNNPAVIGNPDLKAEKMRTWEASLSHSYKEDTTVIATYFNNKFTDKITQTTTPGPDVYANTGGGTVWGIELEAKRKFDGGLVYANYTYLDTEDELTRKELPGIAKHMGNVGADVALTKHLNANVNVFMSGKKSRAVLDGRDDLAGHTVVDAALIAKNFYKGLELKLSGYNIFDEQYEDPSPVDEFGVAAVPGDFPREGASVMAEASYRF